jgi:holo-[acyl-carrier protein] synthase
MIVGMGIDLVEVARIEKAYTKFGERFLQRVLLPDEAQYCLSHRRPAHFIAGRFAVKEAVSKAFGTGIGAALGWHDIEVRRKDSGEPYVVLHGKGEELMLARRANVVHISITHTETSAAAVAILEHVPKLTDA